MTEQYALDADGSVSIWPTVWKFTLILAAFKAAYSLLIQMTGLVGTTGVGLISIVVSVVLLVIALKSFRGRNGYMSFGQGFGIAFVASFVSALIAAIVNVIYFSTIGEEALRAQIDTQLRQAQSNPAVDAQTMEMLRGFFEVLYTPAGIFISSAITAAIGWCIVALILAAIMKKPAPIRM